MANASIALGSETRGVPWYVWASALAVTSTSVGLYWDISWHMSIGRDTFWTPAHLGIHFGAVVAGISSVFLILSTTFGKKSELRATSVKMWGFYGPLGAFVSLWGGLAMLTSAPFDDWWHNAFGLDVQIMSPPHVVLILGIFTLGLGGLFLIVSEMNRADAEVRAKLNRVFLYAGCMLTILLLMLIYEYTDYTLTHSAIFYRVLALAMPPGGDQSGGDLFCVVVTGFVAGAAGPGASEVGAGLYAHLPLGAFRVSSIFVCRGSGAGFFARSHGGAQQMATSCGGGRRLFSCDDGGGVAGGKLFDFPAGAESLVWHRLLPVYAAAE
jgi:hypothetical protein